MMHLIFTARFTSCLVLRNYRWRWRDLNWELELWNKSFASGMEEYDLVSLLLMLLVHLLFYCFDKFITIGCFQSIVKVIVSSSPDIWPLMQYDHRSWFLTTWSQQATQKQSGMQDILFPDMISLLLPIGFWIQVVHCRRCLDLLTWLLWNWIILWFCFVYSFGNNDAVVNFCFLLHWQVPPWNEWTAGCSWNIQLFSY